MLFAELQMENWRFNKCSNSVRLYIYRIAMLYNVTSNSEKFPNIFKVADSNLYVWRKKTLIFVRLCWTKYAEFFYIEIRELFGIENTQYLFSQLQYQYQLAATSFNPPPPPPF